MAIHVFLLQWIFQTQGSNLSLLHWQADFLLLSYLGSARDTRAPTSSLNPPPNRPFPLKFPPSVLAPPVRVSPLLLWPQPSAQSLLFSYSSAQLESSLSFELTLTIIHFSPWKTSTSH